MSRAANDSAGRVLRPILALLALAMDRCDSNDQEAAVALFLAAQQRLRNAKHGGIRRAVPLPKDHPLAVRLRELAPKGVA